MTRRAVLLAGLVAYSLNLYANDRGPSEPFISGDTFRHYSDFTYDELNRSLDPSLVSTGDIVFVKTDYLEDFFTQIHPQITNRYVLLTHNSDYHVPRKFASYLDDDKILAWFGQNVDNCDHPKMKRIPIGIANKMWSHGNVETFADMRQKSFPQRRPILLYMNFSKETFLVERADVVNLFQDKAYCVASAPKALPDYLEDLTHTKFVLSPRGNGLDCHRTWEALLMGAVPIVKSSSLDSMYDGLPVLIVKDWTEINEAFLNQKYEEMKSQTFHLKRAEFAYWLSVIRSFQQKSSRDDL